MGSTIIILIAFFLANVRHFGLMQPSTGLHRAPFFERCHKILLSSNIGTWRPKKDQKDEGEGVKVTTHIDRNIGKYRTWKRSKYKIWPSNEG